ncbi:hypothetical protein D5086_011929 [Populus alba]|uniref:Uncharacterized protein n=1 Tax=Populus alba TaxID=43335 RepID=A0ACC4C2K9_POPAL
MTTRKNVYSKKDTVISYLLLVGAVLLDCYSITVLLLSDWAVIWFTSSKVVGDFLYRIKCLSPLLSFCRERKRWSRSMGQHNLTSAQSNKPLNELRKQYFAGKWSIHRRVDVDEVLKALILQQVMDKRSRYDPDTSDFLILLELLEERGYNALLSKCCFDKLGWSVTDVEFTQSLLIWHVATRVCYIDDSRKIGFAKERNCSLETHDGWPNEKKWEMISEVWVDMLMYAASHCGWKQHADALARGKINKSSTLRRIFSSFPLPNVVTYSI